METLPDARIAYIANGPEDVTATDKVSRVIGRIMQLGHYLTCAATAQEKLMIDAIERRAPILPLEVGNGIIPYKLVYFVARGQTLIINLLIQAGLL